MPEDEFFKRIAETVVIEEPVGDRPLGTAERRGARASRAVVNERSSEDEGEPSAEPLSRSETGVTDGGADARREQNETKESSRRWSRAHLMAVGLLCIASLGVGVVAMLAVGGRGGTPSTGEAPRVLQMSPPLAARPGRASEPGRRARADLGKRRAAGQAEVIR